MITLEPGSIMRSGIVRDVMPALLVPFFLFPCTLALRRGAGFMWPLTMVSRTVPGNAVNGASAWFSQDQESDQASTEAAFQRQAIVVSIPPAVARITEVRTAVRHRPVIRRSSLAPRPPPD